MRDRKHVNNKRKFDRSVKYQMNAIVEWACPLNVSTEEFIPGFGLWFTVSRGLMTIRKEKEAGNEVV